jgi:hypothetical protein
MTNKPDAVEALREYEIVHVCNVGAIVRLLPNPLDCAHEWKEVYYGHECTTDPDHFVEKLLRRLKAALEINAELAPASAASERRPRLVPLETW